METRHLDEATMTNPRTDTHKNNVGMIKRSATLLLIATFFSCTLGFALFRWQQADEGQLHPFQLKGEWIQAPGPALHRSGYFRKEFQLAGNVKNAWIVISACDSYEVSVNRNPLGRHYLWRPTRPFQNGTSEPGQRVTSYLPSLAMSFPREYQWDGHDSFRLPQFFDLTSSFRPGQNVVCVDIESRGAPARVCFHGSIELWTGEIIEFKSDRSWRSEPVPPGLQPFEWNEPNYRDSEWRYAESSTPPPASLWRSLHPEVYSTAFQGKWLRHPTAQADESIWIERSWTLVDKPVESWVRVAANRQFDFFVNGVRVGVGGPGISTLDSGHWVLGKRMALDPAAKPELLDPDEVGSLFIGKRFESPRNVSNESEFVSPLEFIQQGLMESVHDTEANENVNDNEWNGTNANPKDGLRSPVRAPQRLTPKALHRHRNVSGYLGFNITRLLRPGENKLSIRLCEPNSASEFNWQPQLAIDGQAYFESGSSAVLPVSHAWQSRIHDPRSSLASYDVLTLGGALNRAQRFPTLKFRGAALSPASSRMAWPKAMVQTGCVTGLSILGVLGSVFAYSLLMGRFDTGFVLKRVHGSMQVLFGVLCAPTFVILTLLLLESSFAERHEAVFFMRSEPWKLGFGIALISSLLVLMVEFLRALGLRRLRSDGHHVSAMIRQLPRTQLWKFAILWVLLLCGFLRAHKLDMQPLDDDEYASTQAIVGIVETGIPKFVPENVWYSRSPLYHYFTAAIAWVFGPDLWSLRLQSVAWGIATAWLTYVCGRKLLKSPWVGMGAMILVSIHPFQIYTGHIIRFYQMQQFFALLTVYFFCYGFVVKQTQFYRYLTVLTFLAAVLSQEISAVMGLPLAIGYLMFAKDLGWKANIKLAVLSVWAVTMIVLDFAVFQTRCLTRVEGVSPNLEASVKPHFWQPYNFFSIFIGYSRLHWLLSVWLIAGLPLAWREKNRCTIAFHFMFIVGIVLTNLLVTGVSVRYQYWLFPIWILLAVDSIRAVVSWVCGWAYHPRRQRNRHMCSLGISTVVIFVGVVLSWSPWRIPGSYDIKILGDSTGAMRYVSSQLAPGDRIAVTEPHPHCAFIEAGQSDFDISIPLLYDFALNDNGRLIDRNGGAEVVASVDQFMRVCRENDRVWVLLNREKMRTRGKLMRWEYPGARFDMFVRKNCELKYRGNLWSVYLWDANRGFYIPFREHSG